MNDIEDHLRNVQSYYQGISGKENSGIQGVGLACLKTAAQFGAVCFLCSSAMLLITVMQVGGVMAQLPYMLVGALALFGSLLSIIQKSREVKYAETFQQGRSGEVESRSSEKDA